MPNQAFSVLASVIHRVMVAPGLANLILFFFMLLLQKPLLSSKGLAVKFIRISSSESGQSALLVSVASLP